MTSLGSCSVTVITLFVEDLHASKSFYEEAGGHIWEIAQQLM
ncbi:hypothetical protein PAEVO_20020 [Paenibacillus sp. GM2FR]|nr:hypothetical protein [Paenibacillus lautus]MEC0256696.1 hypothetical protein [Paenibacillus lautus]PJN55281.1 hypothetical protein PAEVO_20020 [Paenibacillus sp. GM2FR]